ncbi:MAG TPA: peptide deformylase [Acidimicrobiales bacterium]|nr:peptide deformylase [Acidimicrobiales bacterium]
MAVLPIRIFGDPVLRQRTREVDVVDAALLRLVEDMFETMYDAPGVGLAANQVGVERRLFVYDVGDGPNAVLNPVIVESRGEWEYEEGCLSIPDLSWTIVRPKEVHLRGVSLEGEEIDIEADELLARCFQHEVDHLDGVLIVERLDDPARREAKRLIRDHLLASAPAI